MSGGLRFDEETSRKVETLYLTPDVVAQRAQVLKALELRQGDLPAVHQRGDFVDGLVAQR